MKKTVIIFSIFFAAYGCGFTGSETTPPSAGLYIINASPDAPAMDVTLNNNTIAGGYAYGKDSGYFLAYPGTYEFKLGQTGSSTYLADNLLNLSAGKYYSLFLADSFSLLKILFIEDKLTTDTFSYAKLRLLNLCPNSPMLDASFTNDNDTLDFAGRYFNDQSSPSFSSIPSGTYNLSLYEADTTVLIKSFNGINFENGKHYTVYLKGLYENTITPLDTAVIRH